ncbi:MAG TPA: lytic transglycosylase F [Methylomirabilota bacterium]|nr:lytic transglycosylase F [Methylomirabilota bacterium]
MIDERRIVRRVWTRGPCRLGLLGLVTLTALLPPPARAASPSAPGLRAALSTRWRGDLDGMIKRRQVRILVTHSKTFYFVDRGRQRGATYDLGRAFEDDLNRRLRTGHLKVNVVFIPVSRDELLPGLRDGRGDIAAANLTITDERRALVDFSAPLHTGVAEVVVTGSASPPITTAHDLAGQEVFVRKSSSYHESLVRLNGELERTGKPPVRLRLAPESLEDEDLLEMVNAGLVRLVVVDSHKAEFWAQVLPRLRLHPEAAVRTGGEIAWAFRKGSPRLKAAMDRFVMRHRTGTAFGNQTFQRYLRSTKFVRSALDPAEVAKYERTIGFFRKYGDRYGFDYLMLTAQGYQESQLDHTRRSPAGAIGVMQVLPATGRQMQVGDVRRLDPNVHAGVKYLRFMTDRYFADAPMTEVDKTLFAFASYNAGPAKLARLRREAARVGLNPNVWFNHVERVAAQQIGRETVQYVSNIYKYYVAYRLLEDEREERDRTRIRLGLTAS